jgi:uncharacterized membrane protein
VTPAILDLLCVVIGAASGLRSFTGVAAVALAARYGRLPLLHTRLEWLRAALPAGAALVLALGELVADKLPAVPRRTLPAPLVFRFATGALCGAALATAAAQPWLLPGMLGGGSAVAAAYAGFGARRAVTSRGTKDLPVALVEDAIAILLAAFAVTRF